MEVLCRTAIGVPATGLEVLKKCKSEHKDEGCGILVRIAAHVSNITVNQKLIERENCEMGND
jgi:hypothetical protein